MSKKQTNDEENEELARLKKEIFEFYEETKKNIHREMLRNWALALLTILGAFLLLAFVTWGISYFVVLPQPTPLPLSEIEKIAPIIFSATITINGLVTGFVPLCSFFFIREIRETDKEFEKELEERRKESKGKKQELINKRYKLLSILGRNLRSGVLTYTRTYIFISIFLQIYLVFLFVSLTGYQMMPLYIIIDVLFMLIIFVGIVPLISIALYQPALRPVRTGKVIRYEPEG